MHWDEPASIARPDRVSSWEIEPFKLSAQSNVAPPVPAKNKRPRPPIEISTIGNLTFDLFFSA